MSAIATYLTALWPIAATITPLVLLGGFLWLKTQFAGAKDVADINTNIAEFRIRFAQIETELGTLATNDVSEPTRVDLMQSLAAMDARMSRMEANNEALVRQLGAQNHSLQRELKTLSDYVHSLIEQGLQGTGK